MTGSCALLVCSLLAATGANLIDNPGFESGLAAWTNAFGPGAEIDRQAFHAGTASARISVEGETAGIDAAELIVGYDIDLAEGYRASAWIKSGGVRRGDFGGRVYCYGADDKVLAMHVFARRGAGDAGSDWRHESLELGPAGPHAIPEATERVVLRFSIWAQDGKCDGTLWVDDVAFEPLETQEPAAPPEWLKRSERGTVLILNEPGLAAVPDAGTASDPDAIGKTLSDAGFAVNLVAAERFAAAETLNPRHVDLVVLPYGAAFPADARDTFVRYLRYGGSFLTLGGLAFEKLVRRAGDGWADVRTTPVDWDEPGAVVTDFEGAAPEWDFAHAAEGDRISVEIAGPGADGSEQAARLVCAGLSAYGYAGLTAEARAPDAEHSVLCFWAKGDAETEQLAIEPREEDGSRWKMVVPLTTEWQRFAIPAQRFLAYDTDERGGPGDHLHPERVPGVWFGFTRGMVGGGRREFCLDEIAWRRSRVELGAVPAPMRPGESADLTLAAFGANIAARPGASATIPVFTPVERIEDADGASLSSALDPAGGVARVRGRVSGYVARVPALAARTRPRRGLRLGGRRVGRLVPALELHGPEGASAVGALFLPSGAAQRDAVWAFFGVDSVDLLSLDVEWPGNMLLRIAGLATGSPVLDEPEMTFVAEGEPAQTFGVVTVRVRGRDDEAAGADLTLRTEFGGPGFLDERPVRPGETVTVRCPVAMLGGDVTGCAGMIELIADGRAMDQVRVWMWARDCLLMVCNWLVANQAEDGTFSGVSFQDNRAARGLLGAYEITGEEQYREAAVRWGEQMIERQREDGGYRMGYGITSKGESCYVADGGEIAIAMARLVSYTEGEQRERFIESLRGYFGYRESFREPNGAIGVGWCLHDYGQRPIKPLDKPTRILAGEKNTYTIGCTLAAAAAYAAITKDPEIKAMAVRDTEWLLEHYTSLSGAAAESAIWAHHYVADDELKRRIEEHMRESFVKRIVNPTDRSWLGGGGRAVLDLDIIAYWLDRVAKDAEMEAALGRWLHALCGSNSTSAVRHLLSATDLNGDEKRFICFAAVALADAVQPMVSMKEF